MKLRAYTAERDGAIQGGPDGPIPVQRGDVVLVAVARSWEEHAETLKRIGERKRG